LDINDRNIEVSAILGKFMQKGLRRRAMWATLADK
jgi:hypothetical protein